MSTPKQALADLEKKKNWPVYFLFGEEPFKIAEFIDKVTRTLFGDATASELSFCIDRIDGSQSTGHDVLNAVQSLGLFGGGGAENVRMVVVRQAHQLKELDSLSEILMESKEASPFGDNVLILVAESLDGRRKFHQWMKKKGYALEFKPARDAELAQWVQYLAKKTGAQISGQVADMLAVLSDGSLYRLSQEIEKAWLLAGGQPNTVITPEHVFAISSSQMNHEMIELVKAVLEGKRTRALLLSELLIQSSEDAMGLVGFLTWAIKNPGRGFTGTIVGGARRVSGMVDALVELDERLKSSGLDANALIERFVIEQTQTAF